MRRAIKKHWGKLSLALLAPVAFAALVNLWMVRSFERALFTDPALIPQNAVGLVLGTGSRTAAGQTNLHFTVRIDAAAQLYYAGKVKHLLLSGDNRTPDYDEPTEMKNALLKKGVPESAMTLDYAGLRTLDSVARANRVFGQRKITIVTQRFHGARAAFLGSQFGLETIVFCAEELPWRWEARAGLRELGARVKAVLDVFVLRRGPKHLGKKIALPIAQ